MPVTLGQPPAKRCKQCEDPKSGQSDACHSWSLQLDQDLLDTITAIYPEWFKGYTEGRAAMSEGPTRPPQPPSTAKSSPPHVEVDSSPLHTTMDKNKESLKVKLMMRRPINQLVAQGIIPSLKTPPAFHEQRQKLERAKTGDLLKAKIQRRPDRDELVRQHILDPDMGHVDPSLVEKQRMLKKARLADSLNDQLSHRPGPLELIKKNILHTEEPIERAVKEGVIPFKATSEGLRKAHHPDHYVTFDEDSLSSDNSQNSLPTLEPIRKNRDVLETAAASAGIVTVAVLQPLPAELCSPLSLCSSTSSLSPLSSVASPPTPLTPRPASLPSPAPGKADKNRKKSKTKVQPKARTIKFHEYKGPPSAQKVLNSSNNSNETSYELLLQQQQLFLQWQLEWQHKYPQILLPAPATPKPQPEVTVTSMPSMPSTATIVLSPSPAPTPPSPPQLPAADPPKYEDMKVSDLKEELKRRNLPRSGPKPQLIERLRGKSSLSESSEMEGCETASLSAQASPPPPSPEIVAMDTSDPTPPSSPQNGDIIIAQQQRKIEELQRELQRSQQQLQKMQRKDKVPAVPPPVATVAPVSATPLNSLNLPTAIPLKAVLQNGVLHIDSKKLLVHQQVPTKMTTTPSTNNVNVKASLAARITQHQAQQQLNQLLKNKIFVPVEVKPKPPPPVYAEPKAPAKPEIVKPETVEQKNVKSQVVDDLLDILIRSGELPPSAAQGPITPTTQTAPPPLVAPLKTTPAFPEPAPYPGPYIENMATDFQEVSNNNSDHNFHSNCLDFLLNQDIPTDYNNSNGNVTLKDLGIDLETLDSMDFGQMEEGVNNNDEMPVAMEMDDGWLGYMNSEPSSSEMRPYDPLLCTNQQPFDLFNLEDTDLKLSTMSWDKIDFAT